MIVMKKHPMQQGVIGASVKIDLILIYGRENGSCSKLLSSYL
jgi:hypothetical protein